MNIPKLFFCLILFVLLFAFLQTDCAFHFFYVEQNQLFQWSWPYFVGKLAKPGGLALWAGEFLVQFFAWPYAGAALTAALLTSIAEHTAGLVKRIAPATDLYLIYLLPALALLFVHIDFNYRLQGTVAYGMLLIALGVYLRLKSFALRVGAAFLFPFVLFWLAGPVGALFAGCVVVWEGMNRGLKGGWSIVPLATTFFLIYLSVRLGRIGEFRLAFLPDGYYYARLQPKAVIYYSWMVLPLILVVAYLLRNRAAVSRKKKLGASFIQLCLFVLIYQWGISVYNDPGSSFMKELDYYNRTADWDQVIEKCKGVQPNYFYLGCLNRALAEKGELADRMFAFDQRGVEGLIVKWNKSAAISTFLSDLYFTMGNMALAQEMAFESYVSSPGEGNPRMLQRLVQTNLIYGEYPVAEKYIDLLSHTYFYKDWAERHRTFLYNDEAVTKDSLLGTKRKDLLAVDHLSHPQSIGVDLQRMAEHNPANRVPIHYLGAVCLLNKDLMPFKAFIEKYYGTEVLPSLPLSFQEAVITLSEEEPDYWKKFDISPDVRQRFAEYKRQVLAGKGNPSALPGLLRRSFGDTYWYYFMFK